MLPFFFLVCSAILEFLYNKLGLDFPCMWLHSFVFTMALFPSFPSSILLQYLLHSHNALCYTVEFCKSESFPSRYHQAVASQEFKIYIAKFETGHGSDGLRDKPTLDLLQSLVLRGQHYIGINLDSFGETDELV